MTALIVIVLALIVVLALLASMAASAATANQAQAAIEAARAAQIASAGQTAATVQNTALVFLLVVVVLVAVGLVAWIYIRSRREIAELRAQLAVQQPAGRWVPGPNANWGRVGPGQQQPALQPGQPDLNALVALMLADRIASTQQAGQPRPALPGPYDQDYWR